MSIVLRKLDIRVKKKLSLDLYIVHKYELKIDKRLTYKTQRNQRESLCFLSLGVKKSQNPGDKVATGPAGQRLLSWDDSQQMVPGEKENGQFWWCRVCLGLALASNRSVTKCLT